MVQEDVLGLRCVVGRLERFHNRNGKIAATQIDFRVTLLAVHGTGVVFELQGSRTYSHCVQSH